jgi:hypothetical protein
MNTRLFIRASDGRLYARQTALELLDCLFGPIGHTAPVFFSSSFSWRQMDEAAAVAAFCVPLIAST